MAIADRPAFRRSLAEYEREAETLFSDLQAGSDAAAWRCKWMHPRFRDKSVVDVRAAAPERSDARLVVALDHAFATWEDLVRFADEVTRDGPVAMFETAVEAVVAGDLATLRSLLREHPELPRARSVRRHHGTLLHYVAANGVEGERQQTPPNAAEIANALLEAGAEADALADMYDAKCTTLSMLVSSSHPAEAGLQAVLAETLLDHGAALDGPGSNWQSAVMTALAFGYLDTARSIARRGVPRDNVAAMAGLGRLEETARLLPTADASSRHAALALAAQHGHVAIVQLLLDAGEDPNRYNPQGYHAHSTPLHQAIASDRGAVVRLLVDRGARLDVRDTIYAGTPLGWAVYCKRPALAEYLRSRGAS